MNTELSIEQLQEKKVIVFDLDGTIVKLKVDWKRLRENLSQKFSKLYKTSRSFDRITTCLGEVLEKGDKDVFNEFIELIRAKELEYIEDAAEIKETTYFIKHSKEFGISQDTKFAILSLNSRDTVREAIKLIDIEKKVSYIVGREDVQNWKPNPEGLLKIKAHFGIDNEMVYFGDVQKDVLTGERADVDAYFIDELIKLVNKKIKR